MTFSKKQISTPRNYTISSKVKGRNKLLTRLSWVTEAWFMIRWIKQIFSRTLWKSLSRKTLNHIRRRAYRKGGEKSAQTDQFTLLNWKIIRKNNPLQTKRTHANNNNIIPNFQHGFRENTATNHQLLQLTNLVVNGFNNHETTGGAFLDVEKAFDRVWHDGLLLKLIELNFPPNVIMIINNYPRNRSFQIRISSTLSRTAYASAGCPQDSLLSPLLYNIFTHDFPTAQTVHICLFADDAAIISQACNPDVVRINLQNYLKKLQVWLTKWRIKINVSKSQAIIFKRGRYRNRMQCLKLF
ncbi:RNA-directed DNA polymerase from mobile element jockey [Trichonephila clavipes]|nr:RNA-directed DNA polymerase from mobile element jockey [Trichonephila clavipes]